MKTTNLAVYAGLSPHTRGWSGFSGLPAEAGGVVPARAGMVRIIVIHRHGEKRCPRTRGDGPFRHPTERLSRTLSSRMQGQEGQKG